MIRFPNIALSLKDGNVLVDSVVVIWYRHPMNIYFMNNLMRLFIFIADDFTWNRDGEVM